jgi:hypothetical protein
MSDLKPCPICGEKPNINFCSKPKGTKVATIGHGVQGHQVIVYGYGKTESYAMQDAIEKWNRRSYE